jgi:hypothetical protein
MIQREIKERDPECEKTIKAEDESKNNNEMK